ncbi:MAG: phosphotransferase enzyme family protein [Pseudomonadales bacterium]
MNANTVSSPEEQMLANLRELALSAVPLWGFECKSLKLIKHRENAVYRLETNESSLYALRVHRAGYHSDAALRSEAQWMSALQDSGVFAPDLIPRSSGESFAVVPHPDVAEARQVDLLAWIDGDQLGSVEEGLGDNTAEIERIYATIGQSAARIHQHSSVWTLPQDFVRHAWDYEGLVGNNPFWGRFWELEALTPAQRELVTRARDRVREELSAMEKAASVYGMIHADLVPENLLVDGDNVQLIDFDDAGFGWYMFELATALYFIQDDPNYSVAREALLSSYQAERPLSEEALNTLPLFMLARSFTYLGWVHTREDTETAKELTPMLVGMCCDLAEAYL